MDADTDVRKRKICHFLASESASTCFLYSCVSVSVCACVSSVNKALLTNFGVHFSAFTVTSPEFNHFFVDFPVCFVYLSVFRIQVNEKFIFTSVSFRFPYLVGSSSKARVSGRQITCVAREHNA